VTKPYKGMREYQNNYQKNWRKTHPEVCRKASSKWKKNHPERNTAHVLAEIHIPLVDEKCVICGSMENLIRHHPDYSKPLQVVILCSKDHFELHNRNSRIE